MLPWRTRCKQKRESEDQSLDYAAAADPLTAPLKLVDMQNSHICCVRMAARPLRHLMDIQVEELWNYEVHMRYGDIFEKIKGGKL